MKRLFSKYAVDRIPPLRLLTYLLLLGLVPALLALTASWRQAGHHRACAFEMEAIVTSSLNLHRKGWLNRVVRKQFSGADRFYIDKQLETLSFLEPERLALRFLIEQEPSLPDPQIMQRLEFLEGHSNRLVFSEGTVQSLGDVRETVESLVHPVEVTGEDLQALLEQIEGEGEGRPQLIISDFDIRRRASKRGDEVFMLDLKIIKREYP